jgi:hypothetical protein
LSISPAENRKHKSPEGSHHYHSPKEEFLPYEPQPPPTQQNHQKDDFFSPKSIKSFPSADSYDANHRNNAHNQLSSTTRRSFSSKDSYEENNHSTTTPSKMYGMKLDPLNNTRQRPSSGATSKQSSPAQDQQQQYSSHHHYQENDLLSEAKFPSPSSSRHPSLHQNNHTGNHHNNHHTSHGHVVLAPIDRSTVHSFQG